MLKSVTTVEASLYCRLNRLSEHLDQAGILPDCQYGFVKERGTIDMQLYS